MTEKPLKKYLLEMLKTCQYSDGSFCFFYPLLPIEKGSATEIQEENLCETLLKTQESAYKGANQCVKEGSLFWFKCASGYREVYQKTLGRLRRSVCELPPRSCTQEHREECEKKGEECFVENDKVVCKTKEVSATTTAASPAPGICTKEKSQECGLRDEECIVQNNKAACRKKEESTAAAKASLGAESFTATEASPDLQGSGSSTIFASAINLLSILIFALLA
ncbi:hypothetical protein V5799_005018 [Amblyomma americanum]|uniref:Uncharacterized protein n=1 Tax=Amblyomma americanum TaxID=6943 RepID=A0AAQ4D4G1_AMBAM